MLKSTKKDKYKNGSSIFIMAKSNKKSETYNGVNIVGTVGDNYIVKDCPCLIPKQNIKAFSMMKKGSDTTSTFGQWPSPYDNWHPEKK